MPQNSAGYLNDSPRSPQNASPPSDTTTFGEESFRLRHQTLKHRMVNEWTGSVLTVFTSLVLQIWSGGSSATFLLQLKHETWAKFKCIDKTNWKTTEPTSYYRHSKQWLSVRRPQSPPKAVITSRCKKRGVSIAVKHFFKSKIKKNKHLLRLMYFLFTTI